MASRVVIVSENAKARETLAQEVRRRGFAPTLAGSVDEAQRVLETVPAGLVLLETRRIDARARRQRTRLEQFRPGCRVVLVTSFGAVRQSPDLLQFGPGDFLVSAEVLLAALEPARPPAEPAAEDDAEKALAALVQTVDVLVGLLELGDPHFSGTSNRVTRLVRSVADELGLPKEVVHEAVLASLLKDVGKAALDPARLPGPGEMALDQAEALREHAPAGARLFEHIIFPWNVLPVIRHHHERYDGHGYPDGLKGREIPLGARIVAVADAYVAMCSPRPHRPPFDADEAVQEIERCAGAQFDPEVVEALIRVLEKTRAVFGGTEKPSIVVCDADPEFRKLLQMRLVNDGYDVRCVAHPDEAQDAILAAPPNLVLAEVDGETSGGFQLLREIRKDAPLQHVPFAFLARTDDRPLKIRALRQGVDDFLVKTNDLEELLARVANILTRESTRRGEGLKRQRRGVTGQLDNLGIPDIVQMLAIGMKTACVALEHAGRAGRIWFRDGAAVHAKCGEASGEAAFLQLARWKTGEFAIEHGVASRRTTIENDAMFLVMEAMRLMDEETAPG
jgi:response regulator RpfG family c-di-GMP phosphodiesterase